MYVYGTVMYNRINLGIRMSDIELSVIGYLHTVFSLIGWYYIILRIKFF